jgi:hypothetical protein
MILAHYREIVMPDEAERYWNIFPLGQQPVRCALPSQLTAEKFITDLVENVVLKLT